MEEITKNNNLVPKNNITKKNITLSIEDCQHSEKIERFSLKKENNLLVKDMIQSHLSASGYARFMYCSTYLSFLADKTKTHKKVETANFCKNRFCPMCSWRKSVKDTLELSVMTDWIHNVHKKKFIFMTLTVPNVSGDMLNDEIKSINEAFKLLFKYDELKRIAKGFVRKLEVTYNADRDDYHPHLHVMIAVNANYFKSKDYLSRERVLELWKRAKKDNSITQVDVRAIKPTNEGSYIDSVLEVAKYTAKDADLLASQDVFDVFYKALKGKRLLGFGGLYKEAKDLYAKGELDSFKQINDIEYFYRLIYDWSFESSEYQNRKYVELTDEEFEKINNKN